MALNDGSVTKLGTTSVGNDTKPIKLVNGVATAVTTDLLPNTYPAATTHYIVGYSMYDITNLGSDQYPYALYMRDVNNVFLGCVRMHLYPDGATDLYIQVRNKDGTTKQTTLLAGNH